jgi:hypothetical protein
MSDDYSPGDRRQPYSDRGGPEGRHAETHDVRREALTNPRGPEPVDETFDEQLRPGGSPVEQRGHAEESTPASEDKRVRNDLPFLDNEELSRLSIIDPGVMLEQGGVYLDIDDLGSGPFKAIGGHIVEDGQRVIAKRDTDYELWNRLTQEHREPEIERPIEQENSVG